MVNLFNGLYLSYLLLKTLEYPYYESMNTHVGQCRPIRTFYGVFAISQKASSSSPADIRFPKQREAPLKSL